ncbi:hypothetical protein [Nocardia wallacei]|uniref:hypothetical protein n=1 Tax=Nocardia wallacei TaxID=480035 RepID=UPI002457C39C|nr:hypothetical protein [Nocardia wallacei]
MDVEYCETVIIGAGQQGCGVAAALQDIGREAVVLERAEIGQAWAHERWDSLLVGSGNRSVRFPGWDYDGDDPTDSCRGRNWPSIYAATWRGGSCGYGSTHRCARSNAPQPPTTATPSYCA